MTIGQVCRNLVEFIDQHWQIMRGLCCQLETVDLRFYSPSHRQRSNKNLRWNHVASFEDVDVLQIIVVNVISLEKSDRIQ